LAKSEEKWAEVAKINASVDPLWTGTIAYRALIPAEKLRAQAPDHPILTEPTQVNRWFACSIGVLIWEFIVSFLVLG
jgi:hypothetical protein